MKSTQSMVLDFDQELLLQVPNHRRSRRSSGSSGLYGSSGSLRSTGSRSGSGALLESDGDHVVPETSHHVPTSPVLKDSGLPANREDIHRRERVTKSDLPSPIHVSCNSWLLRRLMVTDLLTVVVYTRLSKCVWWAISPVILCATYRYTVSNSSRSGSTTGFRIKIWAHVNCAVCRLVATMAYKEFFNFSMGAKRVVLGKWPATGNKSHLCQLGCLGTEAARARQFSYILVGLYCRRF